ncbi:MAG: DUF4296 domain-containing protein [Flavobacteriaceae bacterium]
MKNLGFILFSLAMLSCAQERIAKPSPFLSPEQMTNFHVDLALLNATTSFNKDGFVPVDSLYAYHGIDSITFAHNNTYYASKPKVYTKIFEAVKAELESMEELDTLKKTLKTLPKE